MHHQKELYIGVHGDAVLRVRKDSGSAQDCKSQIIVLYVVEKLMVI